MQFYFNYRQRIVLVINFAPSYLIEAHVSIKIRTIGFCSFTSTNILGFA